MIVFRALQGLLGASMIPIVFTSSFYYFEGPRRVYSAAGIGTIASVAPTLGPVIGGWITDTWKWQWLFYVNLLPGVAITILGALLVRIDEPRVVMDDGSQQDFSKNDVMLLPPGHDAWSVGNEPCVFVEFSRGNDYYDGDHSH
jgi:MFS family permease